MRARRSATIFDNSKGRAGVALCARRGGLSSMHCQVAKRKRRRLLTALPQVRILPWQLMLVSLSWESTALVTRTRRVRGAPSERLDLGSASKLAQTASVTTPATSSTPRSTTG